MDIKKFKREADMYDWGYQKKSGKGFAAARKNHERLLNIAKENGESFMSVLRKFKQK